MLIASQLLKKLRQRPLRSALTDDQRAWKNIELLAGSASLAKLIDSLNCSSATAFMLPTSGLAPLAMLGIWRTGRRVVPLNFLVSEDDRAHIFADSGADTCVTVRPMVEMFGPPPPGVRSIYLEDMPRRLWNGILATRSTPDEVATLLYTSGTSGKPKGVELTHGNLIANVSQAMRAAKFTSDDCIFGVLPQFHSFGFTVLTLLPMTVGCRVVYSAKFVPAKVLSLLQKHRPSFLVMIPSMYASLVRDRKASKDMFSSVRIAVSGGEALPPTVREQFLDRFGVEIHEGYGLTETSPAAHISLPWASRLGTVGKALPEVETRIVDPGGAVLPAGKDGEVHLRGPNVMRGYHGMPEATAKVLDANGWFRTGDMGQLDDEGYLTITGRIKEMLIVGGENVFPREIESVLELHPDVDACGVIGRADEKRGEVPVAFVELREGASPQPSELRSWSSDRLAPYQCPRDIVVVENLPRNPTGKVQRRELHALLS